MNLEKNKNRRKKTYRKTKETKTIFIGYAYICTTTAISLPNETQNTMDRAMRMRRTVGRWQKCYSMYSANFTRHWLLNFTDVGRGSWCCACVYWPRTQIFVFLFFFFCSSSKSCCVANSQKNRM